MCEVQEGSHFEGTLVDALEVGQQELAALESLGKQVIDRYNTVGASVARNGAANILSAEFTETRRHFADNLTTHLAEQSDVLSTFNIAFFGRTGAGKSTLLSAFGELDGSAVSPFGESDWTTTVESIPWRGCRLCDTPGINGWGGRKSRAELEAAARKAVEVADIVLLCFDTQSQQASEFTKVADWVMHFGKPVIAVLNVRNSRWRHPARVPSQTIRRNMSEPVAQHAENIRAELANIGLVDVPVVALSSRRALFARATTPYRGPAAQNFQDDHDRYGSAYLARWSNFAALEDVLSACVTAGGSQLRLKSLREGLRARLIDEAASLAELRGRLSERTDELNRLTRRYLEVLGYLEADERSPYLHDDVWHSDLLTLTEDALGARYRTPADGILARQVRNLLKPHLAEARSNALRRFKSLEHAAFHEGRVITPEAFTRNVFDDAEIADALERVSAEATDFLERELSLAGVKMRPRDAPDYTKAGLDGNAGETADLFANLLRGGGLAGGAAAIAAPFLLAGPLGWAAGIGVGAAAAVLQWAGNNTSLSAARAKAEARAKAAGEGRRAVHATFDAIEREYAVGVAAAAWTAAGPMLRPILIELITLMTLRADIDTFAAYLKAEAQSIRQTPQLHLLDVTAELIRENELDGSERRADEFLLGEDWFDHDEYREQATLTSDLMEMCGLRHDQDTAALRHAIQSAFACPDAVTVAAWQRQVARAAESDRAFQPMAAVSVPDRPGVVVAGDYSAGKSSFIKRMITEFGGDIPESLHIRADATTEEVRRYRLGSVDIVDTPGFQSCRIGHDELALAGTRDATLVIVVLHVNLLIGDTTALQAIANGTSTTVGKWPRMLFIINRCDELGVDPLDSTAEYFSRRDRKLTELAASLQSRGIDVSSSHIHGVAADPFGSVGTQLAVTADDYSGNRPWDGIGALVDSLRTWVENDLTQATTLAGFDEACTELLTLRERTRSGVADYRAEADKHDTLIKAMDICLEDANYLHRSLEHQLDDALAASVTQAVARIRGVDVGDDQGLAKAVYSWRRAETQDEIAKFMERATDKVNDWSATHVSAISREESAAGFDANLHVPGTVPPAGAADTVGRAAGAAGWAAGIGARLGKALGNREAALTIGHFFGHKFKPWGAIKAGKAVGRVGVVLGVVAVAADAADWANQVNKKRNWETKRDDAVEQVESDKRDVIRELLTEPEGPWGYLDERSQQVRELRHQYQERQRSSYEEAERLDQRLAVADDLVAAAQKLRKVTNNE